MTIWQLSWNEKTYNATQRMFAAAASEEGKHIVQSWGRSSVKNISKIKRGDIVYISCNKKCIGKAIIVQPFNQTTEVQIDRFAINRPERRERISNKRSFIIRPKSEGESMALWEFVTNLCLGLLLCLTN